MPALESRRVRTHPRTVTSWSTATRPWSTSATGTTLIIFSLLIVGKNRHLSALIGGISMLPGIRRQTSRFRSQNRRKWKIMKGREPYGSQKRLTGFFNLRQIESFSQRAHECFVMTNGFTRTVRKFRHRFAVTFHQFDNNIQRFDLR